MIGFEPAAFAPLLAGIALLAVAEALLPRERVWARALVGSLALVYLARYFLWRLSDGLDLGPVGAVAWIWAGLVLLVELLGAADFLVNLATLVARRDNRPLADRHERRLRTLPPQALPTVDVFIPTYNEGLDVLERTIVGALHLDYPRHRVWVLDDGRRPWLEAFCREKGVGYITRPDNCHAKAGNINHALSRTDGEFVAIFDADFVPQRNFLWRTLGFFEDPRVAVVQAPQRFFNPDPVQVNLGIARDAPEEQRLFFDAIMPGRDAFDAAFFCGSCAVLRRSAVEEIGGIPTDSVTEDILLSLALLRRGRVTRYLPERLALGLAAESTEAFMVQRRRWCRGNIQLLFVRDGIFAPGLRLWHRLLFFPWYWVVHLPAKAFLLLVPAVFLWTGLVPMHIPSFEVFVSQLFTTVAVMSLVMTWLAPGSYVPVVTTATHLYMALGLMPTIVASLVRPFAEGFRVTPKGRAARRGGVDRGVLAAALAIFALDVLGLLLNAFPQLGWPRVERFFEIGGIWALASAAMMLVVATLCFDLPRPRREERFAVREPWRLFRFGPPRPARLADLSRVAAGIEPAAPLRARAGARLLLEISGIGTLLARVAARREGRIVAALVDVGPRERAELERRHPELARPVRDQMRRHVRAQAELPVLLRVEEAAAEVRSLDVSLTGARLCHAGFELRPGELLAVEVPDVGSLRARVVRATPEGFAVEFLEPDPATRERLIVKVYASGVAQETGGAVPVRYLWRDLARRLLRPDPVQPLADAG
ncbi:Cellulose synthase 1 [bacterium HR39]|nr:Cellulose synthase 1 [bacterium HR39]